ncbi:Putative GTP cyclohydrolase 1 type 2, NIF3 family [Lachnospiraceae bacterium NK3A20]|nr:Putative GTP cyclohydrolase 1 type 2, NIF3 family [Lachnospiraceae bacterium NK3A20]
MIIREILKLIKNYYPDLGPDYRGCDGVKIGSVDKICTGVATALVPTVDVIRDAYSAGCNLLIVHEPLNYASLDQPGWNRDFSCSVYEQKVKMIRDFDMTIVRDHDHMHSHKPDSIFTGVMRYMGLEPYYDPDDESVPMGFIFNIPEITVRDFAEKTVKKLHMNGMRYVGRDDAVIRKIAFVFHLFPPEKPEPDTDGMLRDYGDLVIRAMEHGVDAIIPGELIEWTTLSYIVDAMEEGKNLALFNPGHFNWEELGMRFSADYIGNLLKDRVQVTYIPRRDHWKYV